MQIFRCMKNGFLFNRLKLNYLTFDMLTLRNLRVKNISEKILEK